MTNRNHFSNLVILLLASSSSACYIHNTDSGVCTSKWLPASSELDAIEESRKRWTADIPFCGKFVASYYSPCVPSLPTKAWASVDANFPDGRLISDKGVDVHSIRSKDRWVEETVASTIQARIELEKQQGSRHYHYFRNKDCQEAYARYTCWMNFSRCNEFSESMPMCQSACENLFRVCGFQSDIWRCKADTIDGGDDYDIRAFFPGQPFKRNEIHSKSKDPKAVCTPSIKGAAPSSSSSRWALFVGFVSIAVNCLF